MTDRMHIRSTGSLLRWTLAEYSRQQTIFGIPEKRFVRCNDTGLTFFGEPARLPLGPAAGPHTQLAQNIAAAYLTGGRYFELKTVQKLDALEFDKPCIDAADEAYNTEWSTELTLAEAHHEYVSAWLLLHALNHLFKLDAGDRGFLFNMSVGYDLAGIQTAPMDRFINGMLDAGDTEAWRSAMTSIRTMVTDPAVWETVPPEMTDRFDTLEQFMDRVSPRISGSVTLSTMHGCPPEEIESIARYLMTEKNIHTYVKLNPTLLGYEAVRAILDTTGFTRISLDPHGFEKDLQWRDAVPMLKRLRETAAEAGLSFGVKLSNTLAVHNQDDTLPGNEKYMSGRALFPITIRLAKEIADTFGDQLPISYSGGATAFNVTDLVHAGIRPVTLATDLLKPGGYLRLAAMADKLLETRPDLNASINPERISELASSALQDERYACSGRPEGSVHIDEQLPLTDCFVAPCMNACPIHQDVPDYIRLVGEGRFEDALALIYSKNPLPHITGYICDHQCMFHCTRLDYDESVNIRELKRIAAEKGYDRYIRRPHGISAPDADQVAVIGAGPAGLATAYFLARKGLQVTILEKEGSAGGIVQNILPGFRIPARALEKDIAFIRDHGVDIRFNCENQTAASLQQDGYRFVVFATGAPTPRPLSLTGETGHVIDALAFLEQFKHAPETLKAGPHVVVVGGGNTAMDGARAAIRVNGVESVTIIYRRTKEQMPADLEEFNNALKDGVRFRELLNPEGIPEPGVLSCREMQLGEPDDSGRARPVPTDTVLTLPADTIIAAIGELPERKLLEANNIGVQQNGLPEINPETLETSVPNVFIAGDARRGPSTVVQSIADARTVAETILDRYPRFPEENSIPTPAPMNLQTLASNRGDRIPPTGDVSDAAFAEAESRRCLQCKELCAKCVEVCPNRANVLITMTSENGETSQDILHLDGLCNECGNCATFCPYDGAPYKDKLTLFVNREDFESSPHQSGFVMTEENGRVGVLFRVNENIGTATMTDRGTLDFSSNAVPQRIRMFIETVITDFSYLLV